MVEKLSITHYRKLKNIDLSFSHGINLLSGTNGTCKSSILHIISNSFQSVTKECGWVNDPKCLSCINQINSICNPKIESLTRGDKKYNDPAPGHKGELYSIELTSGKIFSFRRHNSRNASRYAVKPYYKAGKRESLTFLPTIYLGLFRLFPYGEFQQDERVQKINKTLPQSYLAEIASLYKDFTGFEISYASQQNMGDIKKRAEFATNCEGIDSNTVSAGEDNLYIILTALVSLKYYFESITSSENNSVESIFLVDELDASLHPAFQIKLLNIFNDYSNKYKIQIFFTTHSFSLIQEALSKKYNVIYLLDHIDSVYNLEDVNFSKIEMHLSQKLKKDIYSPKKIPIFTEDSEARLVLKEIFDYFSEKDTFGFAPIRHYFHFVEASIGSENLKAIFKDKMLLESTLKAICILDGDAKVDLNNSIVTLPGKLPPEGFIIKYVQKIYDERTDFWRSDFVINLGYSLTKCRDTFIKDADAIEEKIEKMNSAGTSTHGVRREESKTFFNNHYEFIQLAIRDWLHSPQNATEIYTFYVNLWTLFKKVSKAHGMYGIEWVKAESLS